MTLAIWKPSFLSDGEGAIIHGKTRDQVAISCMSVNQHVLYPFMSLSIYLRESVGSYACPRTRVCAPKLAVARPTQKWRFWRLAAFVCCPLNETNETNHPFGA